MTELCSIHLAVCSMEEADMLSDRIAIMVEGRWVGLLLC